MGLEIYPNLQPTFCEPPEMGYRLSNRQGIKFPIRNLLDEFIVTLRIFYDDEFEQKFSSNSSDK